MTAIRRASSSSGQATTRRAGSSSGRAPTRRTPKTNRQRFWKLIVLAGFVLAIGYIIAAPRLTYAVSTSANHAAPTRGQVEVVTGIITKGGRTTRSAAFIGGPMPATVFGAHTCAGYA